MDTLKEFIEELQECAARYGDQVEVVSVDSRGGDCTPIISAGPQRYGPVQVRILSS